MSGGADQTRREEGQGASKAREHSSPNTFPSTAPSTPSPPLPLPMLKLPPVLSCALTLPASSSSSATCIPTSPAPTSSRQVTASVLALQPLRACLFLTSMCVHVCACACALGRRGAPALNRVAQAATRHPRVHPTCQQHSVDVQVCLAGSQCRPPRCPSLPLASRLRPAQGSRRVRVCLAGLPNTRLFRVTQQHRRHTRPHKAQNTRAQPHVTR